MDARTALTQIAELIDDVESEYPECADKLRDAVSEAREKKSQARSEDEPRSEESDDDKPKDFKSASKAAMADPKLFGRDQKPESESSDEEDEEDEKKKRDRAKAF